MNPTNKTSPEDVARIIYLSGEAGLSVKEIGKMVGRGRNTVWRILVANGCKRRMPEKTTPEEADKIVHLYTVEKLSLTQIGKIMGKHFSTISRVLKRETKVFDWDDFKDMYY